MIIYYYHYILLVITIVIINIMISIVILRPMISKENSNCVRTRMRRFLKFIRQHAHEMDPLLMKRVFTF